MMRERVPPCRAVVAVGTVVGSHREIGAVADGIGLTDSMQKNAQSASQSTKLQEAASEVHKMLRP